MPHKRLLALLFFLLIAPPQAAKGAGAWPLFSFESYAEKKELEVLGPLFVWRSTPQRTEWGLRPFVYRTKDQEAQLLRWEFLYPFGKYQLKEGEWKAYLVPFTILRDEVTTASPGCREANVSLLTAFWGRTDDNETYGGLFPLAGQFKERFGRERISFYIWPLYSRIDSEGEVSWRIPWPIISLFAGEARGVYIWPLWGKKERVGEYAKGFFLWPFYAYMDERLNTDDPISKRFYLPIYATIRSRGMRTDLFFPPLFLYQEADSPRLQKWQIPWPFITLVRGEGVWEIEVFPFYRRREEEQNRRLAILWPIYKYEWDTIATQQEQVHRFLLINRYRRIKDLTTGKESVSLNVWPLFDYQRTDDGEQWLYVFPLLPLHDEGMQRNIYPLFWLYRYCRSLNGDIFSDLLWGLYRRRRTEAFSSTQLAFLMRIEKKGADDLYLSLLEGLFCYEKKGVNKRVGLFLRREGEQ